MRPHPALARAAGALRGPTRRAAGGRAEAAPAGRVCGDPERGAASAAGRRKRQGRPAGRLGLMRSTSTKRKGRPDVCHRPDTLSPAARGGADRGRRASRLSAGPQGARDTARVRRRSSRAPAACCCSGFRTTGGWRRWTGSGTRIRTPGRPWHSTSCCPGSRTSAARDWKSSRVGGGASRAGPGSARSLQCASRVGIALGPRGALTLPAVPALPARGPGFARP